MKETIPPEISNRIAMLTTSSSSENPRTLQRVVAKPRYPPRVPQRFFTAKGSAPASRSWAFANFLYVACQSKHI